MSIISFNDVWEMYRIKFVIEGKSSWEDFQALQGISFSMEKGEILGIIGENGSGKSTILRLIAGMLKPDRGEIEVSGSVAGLLELGAGFQTELTGRENIVLQCELFGLPAVQAKEKFRQIIDFAEIGKFIDAPVKCYSQGMFVRLAFAIAVHMDSDIFLVDDTLSVGDEYFQRKCIKEIFRIKQQGKTVVIVTHDMTMLQKLCARTIFLKQGMLVKDEETAKVVSFYSQTVGSPKGIAVIEKKRFGLAFNNGKLLLNWDGKLITSTSGAYTIFNVANKWYSSTQAEWEVKEEPRGVFTAVGKIYQLGLTQVWRFEVLGDCEIKWDIELEMDGDVRLSEMYVNIALKDEYSRWFSNSEKGDFPPIKNEDKNWNTVFTKNGLSAHIGVYQQILDAAEFPSLLFEQLSLGSLAQGLILNSDYLSHCRILQYKLNPFSGKSGNQTDRFICFAGKIIINTPDIDAYISKVQNEFVLSTPESKLAFDNGICRLEYKSVELTKNNHIFTSLYANGKWHFSHLAHWDFKKQNDHKIIAIGRWPDLALTQSWEIEVIDGRSFKWDVNVEVEEELVIEQQYFFICCSNDYSQWFSNYGSGVFPADFRETEMDMLQRCLPDGELGFLSQEAKLPALRVKFSNEFHNYAKIMNSNFYEKARLMRIDKVEPERIKKFPPGKYPCFKLVISMDGDKQVFDPGSNELNGERLKFIFNQGGGRVLWDGQELTKRIGFYTSLCSGGRWHDSSSSARWKVVEKGKDVIKITGEWLYLPISQYWEISLKEDKFINFIIRMNLDKALEVEALQANLMLSEIYSQWVRQGQVHSFPGFNSNVDDKWDIIYSCSSGPDGVGVVKAAENGLFLPAVTLSAQEGNSGQLLNVVNSDIYHRGRVLQCSNTGARTLAAGDYLCFNGKIVCSGD